MRAAVRRFAIVLLAWVAGCATPPAAPPAQALLRLPPSTLGGRLALHQQLLVQARGATHRLEVLLEADEQSVRLAVMGPGAQAAARITWDGQRLAQAQAPWWPSALSAERVMSDLQLVLWPAAEVARALPAGWTLEADDGQRRLRCGDELVATVRYTAPARAELTHWRDAYRIRIDSRPLGEAAS